MRGSGRNGKGVFISLAISIARDGNIFYCRGRRQRYLIIIPVAVKSNNAEVAVVMVMFMIMLMAVFVVMLIMMIAVLCRMHHGIALHSQHGASDQA